MKKFKKLSDRVVMHPMMSFLLLTAVVIVLSGILDIFGASVTYSSINSRTGNFTSTLITVDSLFSLSGIKYVFSTTVKNFADFTPLSTLLISLIGIGIMDKSGFLDTLFFVLTKKLNKAFVTFILVVLCLIASVTGDLTFVIFIPLSGLLFKYGKRNPMAGIITAFISLSLGYGVHLGLSGTESALVNITEIAAGTITRNYHIDTHCYTFIMLAAVIFASIIITYITERVTVPKLGKYQEEDEIVEDKEKLTRKEKRGLLFAGIGCIIYMIFFIWNIIPNAPLGGKLLNYAETRYIDMLFGANSFFADGYVFVITFLFFLAGLLYGIGSKNIENHRDIADYLGHSLDEIGKVIVLIFFASLFISILRYTKIGDLLTGIFANIVSNIGIGGIPLLVIVFMVSLITTPLLPSFAARWNILNGSFVPLMMTAGFTPEFAQLTFTAASSIIYGLTPAMAYFVIYVAYMEKYGKKEVGNVKCIKLLQPYAFAIGIVWLALLILWYLVGMPLGIATGSAL